MLHLFVRDVLTVMKPTVGAQQSQGNDTWACLSHSNRSVLQAGTQRFIFSNMDPLISALAVMNALMIFGRHCSHALFEPFGHSSADRCTNVLLLLLLDNFYLFLLHHCYERQSRHEWKYVLRQYNNNHHAWPKKGEKTWPLMKTEQLMKVFWE